MKRTTLKEYVSRRRNRIRYGTGIYYQIKNCSFDSYNKLTTEEFNKFLEMIFANK